MFARLCVAATLGAGLVGLAAGCGSGVAAPTPDPVAVTGKVILPNGKPLTAGTVAFFPVEATKGQETFGILNAQGQFATTVIPGRYKVAVEPDGVRKGTAIRPAPIPKAFRSPTTSGLEVEIPAGGRTLDDIVLK
jgi:hypothetical protein